MRRRPLVPLLLAGMLPLAAARAFGQATPAPRRIGMLGIGSVAGGGGAARELVDGLRGHGLVEGRDFVLDERWSGGQAAQVDELAPAIAALPHADAWFINESQIHFAHRKTIVELIARQRKPAIYPVSTFVEEGGLMSYSVDQKDQFRRAGEIVDRILRGARPADIPVEQPTKFTLALNRTTAKALGLTIPQSLLLRADEVIQ
jgi:hypothetical protein